MKSIKYVALLRGINIGGRNKINMKHLVKVMEAAGFQEVSTYINSGNVFFQDQRSVTQLHSELETLIKLEFDLNIKVFLRNSESIIEIASALPAAWCNNDEMKCDVIFLASNLDSKNVLTNIAIKPEIDEVHCLKGALLWKVSRHNLTKSGMMQLSSTAIYSQMTIRNCNTLRKLAERLH